MQEINILLFYKLDRTNQITECSLSAINSCNVDIFEQTDFITVTKLIDDNSLTPAQKDSYQAYKQGIF
jgi:hypothetical protein